MYRYFCRRFLGGQGPLSYRLCTKFADNFGNTWKTGLNPSSLASPVLFLSRTMSDSSQSGPTASGGQQNRLGLEKSPYLLQHATNPVDWYPWGEEAFKKAKEEDKIIFLSVGYSTCHWCHVMERESFENEEIGDLMNKYFVNIKVDREERPDVDKVYMSFVQATTGGGGWPMSVWLTPDLKPIVGGTYFPPDDRYHGKPGLKSILLSIALKWRDERQKMDEQGTVILDAMMRGLASNASAPEQVEGLRCAQLCFSMLHNSYDEQYGGFGTSPKFPQPVNFNFLLRKYAENHKGLENKVALKMVTDTLQFMAKGGIHDHIAMGFHRYSTDQRWHVPHFEKMLYDQAQLAVSYAETYQITKNPVFAEITRDILNYVSRDLSDPNGGFYSAEDADSLPAASAEAKREGAFCVWTFDEVQSLLGQPLPGQSDVTMADVFCYHYSIKRMGNVDPYQDPHDELKGQNVLAVRQSLEDTADKFCMSADDTQGVLRDCCQVMFEARQKRPAPHLDNKMLTAWNGLMISGFAKAGQVLGERDYVEKAKRAAQFIRNHVYNPESKELLRSAYVGDSGSISQNQTPIPAFADDYAFVIRGLLDLYEACLEEEWLVWAEQLQDKQDELFWDQDGRGGYFTSGEGDKSIVVRMKEDHDGAEPSANSVAAGNLLRLAAVVGRPEWRARAGEVLAAFAENLQKIPAALPEMVCAHMLLQATPTQIIIAGENGADDTEALLRCVHAHFLPHKVLLLADGDTSGFLHDRLEVLPTLERVGGKATAYVCENFTCALPVNTVEKLEELLCQREEQSS